MRCAAANLSEWAFRSRFRESAAGSSSRQARCRHATSVGTTPTDSSPIDWRDSTETSGPVSFLAPMTGAFQARRLRTGSTPSSARTGYGPDHAASGLRPRPAKPISMSAHHRHAQFPFTAQSFACATLRARSDKFPAIPQKSAQISFLKRVVSNWNSEEQSASRP